MSQPFSQEHPHSPYNPHISQENPADSAGTDFADREIASSPFAGDDGSADPLLIAALQTGDRCSLLERIRSGRIMIPVVASPGEIDESTGFRVEKDTEMSVPMLENGGVRALPIFASVDALQRWNPQARPIPITGVDVARAALDESAILVLIDEENTAEISGLQLYALADNQPWDSPAQDQEVRQTFSKYAALIPEIIAVQITLNEAGGLIATLDITPGGSQEQVQALIRRYGEYLAADEVVRSRVESLQFALRAADRP